MLAFMAPPADQYLELRPAQADDFGPILSVINEAASAYCGHIPPDRFKQPYMTASHLREEIEAGVGFWVAVEREGAMIGVMGSQDVGEVTLIRHAYVQTNRQRTGVGSRLLARLLETTNRPKLVGTWSAADWAVAFYRKHGFELATPTEKTRLLRRYWNIPERQIETSVVLFDERARASGIVSITP